MANVLWNEWIWWRTQACSYKLGQLKIRELRERAKQQLGPKFDLKTFRSEILSGEFSRSTYSMAELIAGLGNCRNVGR